MTRYTVVWLERALAQLADLWNNNPGRRQEISDASNAADKLLRLDPQSKVEPLTDSVSVAVIVPLVLGVRIKEADRIVEISGVQVMKPRRFGR